MAKVAGVAYVSVDGKRVPLRGNWTITIGTEEKETIMGQDGYHGVKVKKVPATMEGDLTHQPDVDLNVVQNLSNVTVACELSNGARAVIRNAEQIARISLKTEDGLYSVKFEAPEGEWTTVAAT